MDNVYCKKDVSLTTGEKETFSKHLRKLELSHNIWDLFQEWVSMSAGNIDFFYLKVYRYDELIGLALFLKIKSFDIRASYSKLRKNGFLSAFASVLSTLGRNCVYLSLRNLVTANITRPFFYKEPEMEDIVMAAILNHLKNEKEADMVTIIDTSKNDNHYESAGFVKYPCSSEAWFDATRYSDITEYLNEHRSLKKNLSRRKSMISEEICQGPVSDIDKKQIKECIDCSVANSRVYNPCQQFFEDNLFKVEVFNSDKYVHIFIRIDNKIAGFHTFQVSGSSMGGVVGGFNRDYSQKNFVYERVIVASLDFAIKNNIKRVHYSLIDNYTKLRLVDSLEPCGIYFYSRNPLNRSIFKFTFKFSDVFELYLLEKQGLSKYGG